MKLYNRTHCPDAILTALLADAARKIGARSTGVVVRVSVGCSNNGVAHRCDWVCVGSRRIATDYGDLIMRLPCNRRYLAWPGRDDLATAEGFYRLALHEWGHILDFQQGNRNFSSRSNSGRRPNHDNRPEEMRANYGAKEALERIKTGELTDPSDEILALALWLESICGEKL